MTEEKEENKEIEMLLDRIYHKGIEMLLDRLYQAEVITSDLKHDYELRLAKTKTECRTNYKGKELKVNLDLLDAIGEERIGIIHKARTGVQIEIIKDYVKSEMEK